MIFYQMYYIHLVRYHLTYFINSFLFLIISLLDTLAQYHIKLSTNKWQLTKCTHIIIRGVSINRCNLANVLCLSQSRIWNRHKHIAELNWSIMILTHMLVGKPIFFHDTTRSLIVHNSSNNKLFTHFRNLRSAWRNVHWE